MKVEMEVNRFLLLDREFEPKDLEDNQAVIGVINGKYVMMKEVSLDEIRTQVIKQDGKIITIS